ncbi:secreted RxLR effector protein 161-like [Apium graveolens]|uniref:secreted RxLR effector protein 161-like n=1 Tax=Apium graveolens TaxID=4045 RepID=UPI003D79B618
MLNCEPIKSPIEQNHGLEECNDQIPANKGRYQRLVGRLIYLSHTRPDIAYAVSVVNRFMHNPGKQHMDAVVRILRYLKSAPGKGLLFLKHGNTDILGYSDSSWAEKEDRKLTSGYLTFVGGNLVTWKSKKQKVVSLSSAEAEYRAMVKGICELLWLKRLMGELGFSSQSPMQLFCDNQSVIKIAKNPVQHDRTKHVKIDRNFIYEKLENNEVEVPYVSTKGQLADMLTKALSNSDFADSLVKLGIYDIYAPP